MSWQAYVDNIIASGKVDQGAIYSRAGDSVWATSAGFNVSAAEISEVVRGFDNPAGLQENGLHVQGQKYFLLRADDRSIYGKHEDTGIIAVRTKQAVLIAHYAAPVQPGEATKVVEAMADYLISASY